MSTMPSSVALAVSDPKCATTSGLESALRFYVDDIEPGDMDLIADEFGRRGGDPEYMGYHSD